MDYIQLQSPYAGAVFIIGAVLLCVGVICIASAVALASSGKGESGYMPGFIAFMAAACVFLFTGLMLVSVHADNVTADNLSRFESSYGIGRKSIVPGDGGRSAVRDVSYGSLKEEPKTGHMRVAGRHGVETKTYVIDGKGRLYLYNGSHADKDPVRPTA